MALRAFYCGGLCLRSDIEQCVDAEGELLGDADEEEPDDEMPEAERLEATRQTIERLKADSDKQECLFLVEGRQLCYGNKKAWNVASC